MSAFVVDIETSGAPHTYPVKVKVAVFSQQF